MKSPAVAVLFIALQVEYFYFYRGKGVLSIGIQHGVACNALLLGCLPKLPVMAAAFSSLSFGEKTVQEREKSCCALKPTENMNLSLDSHSL